MGRTYRSRNKKKRQQIFVHSEETNEYIINLKRWMIQRGWENISDLVLANFSTTERGLYSKRKIAENDRIISIPLKLMITFGTIASTSYMLELFNPEDGKLTIHELISIFIVLEHHKNDYSYWKHYFKSLPRRVQIPWICSDDELKLFPSYLQPYVQYRRFKLENSWQNVLNLTNNNWRCSCCKQDGFTLITKEIFEWAYVIVNTRGVYINPNFYQVPNNWPILSDEPNIALCPFLDMFNHSDLANTVASVVNDNYELISLTNYDKYEQIFISYGCHDNLKLFCEYGFFIPGNKLDNVQLNIKNLFNLKLIKLDRRQYNYAKEKAFTEDLFVDFSGPSFNFKGLLFISFNTDYHVWNEVIFNENYSVDDRKKMYEICVLLLEKNLKELTLEMESFENRKSFVSADIFESVSAFTKCRLDFV
ncbi:SET domain-containing protein 4, partial [Agrilus planipennis]|uniref:SET domain-containing protein 4 n=1 Tax=Agrilus planipennis TaxID=224129 RepID=A0A1W4X1X0_AGRPL